MCCQLDIIISRQDFPMACWDSLALEPLTECSIHWKTGIYKVREKYKWTQSVPSPFVTHRGPWVTWAAKTYSRSLRVFGSKTRETRVTPTTWTSLPNTKNQRKCCPSWTTQVTLQFMGSTSVASVAASGVLLAASGVVCDSSLFSLEIAVSTKLLTSDGARTKTSVSLIKQVALVGQ